MTWCYSFGLETQPGYAPGTPPPPLPPAMPPPSVPHRYDSPIPVEQYGDVERNVGASSPEKLVHLEVPALTPWAWTPHCNSISRWHVTPQEAPKVWKQPSRTFSWEKQPWKIALCWRH